ncbi:LysR family transcriptional regulator [Vibrio sp. TBV020]|uniref:LysR family transcriptional regulator n=1 Tax=Vibrio sp. TBV020 TaxID=3137398 RepID=UPI0038CD97D5
MYSIEQLEAFVATVEQGSFSAAARSLNKVQSAISQHIMNLEIDSGLELFDRSSRYPKLTLSGTQLLPHAKASLQQHYRLRQCIAQIASDESTQLSLAVDEGIPMDNLSSVIEHVSEKFPGVTFEFLSASSVDVIELVESQRATTGVMFSETSLPVGLDFESVGSIEFDVYVGAKHILAQQRANNVDQLILHRQLLVRSKNSKTSSFQKAYSPDVWYADNYYMLRELIQKGFGWGVLPKHIATYGMASNDIVRVPVEFENLNWNANVDIIQHPAFSSHPIHAYLRSELRQLLGKPL